MQNNIETIEPKKYSREDRLKILLEAIRAESKALEILQRIVTNHWDLISANISEDDMYHITFNMNMSKTLEINAKLLNLSRNQHANNN